KEFEERLAQCREEHKGVQAATVRRFDQERSMLREQIAALEASPEANSVNNKETIFALRAELADNIASYEKTVKSLQDQLAQLHKTTTKENLDSGSVSMDLQHYQRKTLQDLRQAREEASTLHLDNLVMRQELENSRAEVHRLRRHSKSQDSRNTKDPNIDIWTTNDVGGENLQLCERAGASCATSLSTPVESSHDTPLSVISINRHNGQSLPKATQAHSVSPSKDDSSFGHPFLQQSMESSLLALPSPETFHSSAIKSARARYTTTASPRPSMFSLASSPPKLEPMRPPLITGTTASARTVFTSTRDAERDHRKATTASISSSRDSSLVGRKTKSPLPPDRAAAAKERLKQRNEEKRRARENGMENVRG
ncbi:MAG: hypothetical protein M1830_003507, partial [Pleopsidium flavum]